jgi:hypothetical protein
MFVFRFSLASLEVHFGGSLDVNERWDFQYIDALGERYFFGISGLWASE